MKERIVISDIMAIHSLANLAAQTKSNKNKFYYLRQMISKLATPIKSSIKNKHVKYLNELLREADILSQKKSKKNWLKKFDDFICYIAVKVNKTPQELKTLLTPYELKEYSRQVLIRDLQKAESMIQAYHIPKEYHKQIIESLRKLKNKAKEYIESDTIHPALKKRMEGKPKQWGIRKLH